DTKSTAYGEPIEDAVNVCLKSKQIIAAGVNCVDPTLVEPIVERISNIDRDIIVYPNAGNTWNEKLRQYNRDGQSIVQFVSNYLKAGVKWIGGCCGVDPDSIRQIKQLLVEA
ncbi:unnamed protein product, partial [Didymodactylos carnosus]